MEGEPLTAAELDQAARQGADPHHLLERARKTMEAQEDLLARAFLALDDLGACPDHPCGEAEDNHPDPTGCLEALGRIDEWLDRADLEPGEVLDEQEGSV